MKLLHLVGNKAWGGGEQYVYDIADSLQREGNFPPEIVCKDIDSLNQNFSRLKYTRITHLPLSGYFDLRSILALANAIKKERKCIIHAHDFKRAFIALAARKLSHNKEAKVIMTRHLVRKAKKSIIERFIYRNIDKIIFVSNLAKDAFLSTSPEIDLGKCLVIHNGVKDRSNSNAKDLRKEYSIPDNEIILMYHGRITHEKGVEVIIKALARLPEDIVPIQDMKKMKVRMIGSVAAGQPILAQEEYEGYVDSPVKCDYALCVKGDSMIPQFENGDVIYIREQPDVTDGTVAVVLIDDEATLKRVYHRPYGLQLIANNPSYAPIDVNCSEHEYVRILGIVCGFTRMFKH